MKWEKPTIHESRFGFEVTMYVSLRPLGQTQIQHAPVERVRTKAYMKWMALCMVGLISGQVSANFNSSAAWPLHGFDRTNSADSSSVSVINKNNLHKLKLKWIYKPGVVPLGSPENPIDNPRAENGTATGVAVDKNGIAYVPLFDGRILAIDSNTLDGVNADDGTAKPKLLFKPMDLFSDPKYSGASQLDGDDAFATRMHPSIIDGAIYAGKYNFFAALAGQAGKFADKGVGTLSPTNLEVNSQGAVLYKINRFNGKLIWKTIIDDNPQSMISAIGASPVNRIILNDLIIVSFATELSGTLGLFEFKVDPSLDPFGGNCCDFRGGIAAVRASDGKVIWKTYTMPKQNIPSLEEIQQQGTVNAWTGTSIWGGGNFPVSYKHRLVYAGTGEAYNAPIAADQCQLHLLDDGVTDQFNTDCLRIKQDGNTSNASFSDTILEKLNPLVRSPKLPLPDSVIALNMDTGKIQWTAQVGGYDVWNASGFPGFFNFTPFFPPYLRGDYFVQQFTIKDLDIAEQPMLVENVKMANGKIRDVILVTTKATTVNAFDAATGEKLWGPVRFGLGSLFGDGILWGSATDGKRIYSNTGISSDISMADMNNMGNPKRIVKDSCIASGFKYTGPALPEGEVPDPSQILWQGGMYTAINIAKGTVDWQRCVVGKSINSVTRLLTGEQFAGRSQAALSVSNGIVVAPGASAYVPFQGDVNTNTFAEVLLLDANSGKLLRSLPLGVDNTASANTITYQRPIIVGNRLYITNGNKRYDGLSNPLDKYNRVIMYELDD